MSAIRDEYKIVPDEVINVAGKTRDGRHAHVLIHWAGGEVWLDMSKQSDHFCIDVRQFNKQDEMKGQGIFTIVNGERGRLDTCLPDTEGNIVRGHRWEGGYVITLLTDEDGKEESAMRPSAGNG